MNMPDKDPDDRNDDDEVDSVEPGHDHGEPGQPEDENDDVETVRFAARQVDRDQDKSDEDKAAEMLLEEMKAEEIKVEKVPLEELTAPELKLDDVEAPEVRSDEDKCAEDEAGDILLEEMKAEEVKVPRVPLEELKADKIDADEMDTIRSAARQVEGEDAASGFAAGEVEDIVEADKIDADIVEADKIDADIVEADKIDADIVEAEKIDADIVEADRLEPDEGATDILEAGRIKDDVDEIDTIRVTGREGERPEGQLDDTEQGVRGDEDADRDDSGVFDPFETQREGARPVDADEADDVATQRVEAWPVAADPMEADIAAAYQVVDEDVEADRLDTDEFATRRVEVPAIEESDLEARGLDERDLEADMVEPDMVEADAVEGDEVETRAVDVRGLAAGLGAADENGQHVATVRVRGLNHFYGRGEARSQVLFNNNLDVMPGEIVIMTGPSGSGKTTLLTLLGGLRTIQEGSVQVLGQELYGQDTRSLVEVRRRIGFIFQAHNLFESLTALQTVQMALELNDLGASERRQRATDMLTAVGLGHRIHYKPSALSGGQKQRVAIARALANRPKLILADEPTAALDEKSGRDVVCLLQQLAREEQCTSIIVTHDNRILDVADRIVNMVGGQIISNVLVEESVVVCEFLSRCEVFSGFSPDLLSSVAEKMVKEFYSAGTDIVRQGDEGDKFYLIRKGTVDVIIGDGEAEVVRTMGEGEFFGERALLTGEKRSATVRAREDVETYALGKADFEAALAASDSFRERLRKVYFQRQ